MCLRVLYSVHIIDVMEKGGGGGMEGMCVCVCMKGSEREFGKYSPKSCMLLL